MDIKQVIFAEMISPAMGGTKPVIQGVLPGYIILPFNPSKERAITYSLAVAIIGVMPDHINIEIPPVHIDVISPSGETIASGDSDPKHAIQVGASHNNANLASAFMVMDMRNFPFAELGEYKFVFKCSDKEQTHGLIVTVVTDTANNTQS